MGTMDRLLRNRFESFAGIIKPTMIAALEAKQCLTEDDYYDAAATAEDARKTFPALADLKINKEDGSEGPVEEVHAEAKMALGKLVRMWNQIHQGLFE